MIGRVAGGADLCMGSRFKAACRGAMPWKNRYIGNPALTGILNLFFNAKIDDAHCGLRAIRRDALLTLACRAAAWKFRQRDGDQSKTCDASALPSARNFVD